MRLFARHRAEISPRSPSHRLLWASLLLALLLLLTFGAALFLFISLHNTKKDTVRSLEIQFAVFQNDMDRYFDQLAVMGVSLSEDMSNLVEQQLAAQGMTSFRQLNDAPEALTALQDAMLEPLCHTLRQTSCSGAFVLLDATINSHLTGAEQSRAGLYVQKSGADTPTVPLLLYRGSAEVGKSYGVMPHRKWRMEFQTNQFPDYTRWMTPSDAPLYQCSALTGRFTMPGTSEGIQFFLLPLRGADGTMYGLGGFELSESYFKAKFPQPSGFAHLSCLVAPVGTGLDADAALSSGTTDGYYHVPRGPLVLRPMGSGLTQFTGSDCTYVGISERCALNENNACQLAVCIPQNDYQRWVFAGSLQMILIGLLLAFFVTISCVTFHRRILTPTLQQIEEESRAFRQRMAELQQERQQMQTELTRLADVCKNDADTMDSEHFMEGLPKLTKTERRIFDCYAAGLRSRDIMEQLEIKDSTLRFHNRNIYAKLGINSLKQLQQYIAVLHSDKNDAALPGQPPEAEEQEKKEDELPLTD